FLEVGGGFESEFLLGALGVEAAAGLAVGFGGVPAEFTVEAAEAADGLGEVLDRDLHAGTEIDRLGAVVAVGRHSNALGGVADEEEFAGGGTCAPDFIVIGPFVHGCAGLADEGGDHVTAGWIKVVARSIQIYREQRAGVEAIL